MYWQSFDYDAAQICLNGHTANSSIKQFPADSKAFCDICGEKTIDKCQTCGKEIRGDYVGVAAHYDAPSFCLHCGQPFPWLSSKLNAAEELADMIDEFSEEEKEVLKLNLRDLVRDTPRTQIAAIKVKKVLSKTTPNIVNAFRDILVNVISEPINDKVW